MTKAVIFDYHGVIRNIRLHREVLDLASELRRAGIKTAILSNMARPIARFIRNSGDIDDFLPVVFSSEVGHSKPDPEIYRVILKELNLESSEVIFVDDKLKNLAPAEALGMEIVHAKNPSQIVEDIRKLVGLKLVNK